MSEFVKNVRQRLHGGRAKRRGPSLHVKSNASEPFGSEVLFRTRLYLLLVLIPLKAEGIAGLFVVVAVASQATDHVVDMRRRGQNLFEVTFC